jgi:hypothetical protein
VANLKALPNCNPTKAREVLVPGLFSVIGKIMNLAKIFVFVKISVGIRDILRLTLIKIWYFKNYHSKKRYYYKQSR